MLGWQDTIPADGGDINDVAHQFRTEVIGIHQRTPSFPSNEFVRSIADMSGSVQSKFFEDSIRDEFPLQRIAAESDVDGLAVSYSDGRLPRFSGTYTKTDSPINAELLYPGASERLLRQYDDANPNPVQQFQELSDQQRGEYIEEQIAPDVLEDEYGYEVLCKGSACGGNSGVDILAWDPKADGGDGELVVIDSKWKSKDGRTGAGILEPGRDVDGVGGDKKCLQMSQCWVRDSIEAIDPSSLEDVNSDVARQIHGKYGVGNFDDSNRGLSVKESLEEASKYREGNDDTIRNSGDAVSEANNAEYRRELFVARPHQSGKTVTDSTLGNRNEVIDKYEGTDLSEFVDGTKHIYFDNSIIKGE